MASRRARPAISRGVAGIAAPPPAWAPLGLYPAALLVVAVFLTITTISDPDVWFHLALGREVVEHGKLPRADIFSFTAAGREWISSGWLSSVLMYLLFTAGSGPDALLGPSGGGLVLMVFAVVAAVALLPYFASLRLGAPRGSMALVVVAAMMLAAMRYNPRPDIWSQLLVCVVALLLVTAPTGRHSRRLWLLPAIFALWPNLHAGFIAGLIPVSIFTAARAVSWRRGVPGAAAQFLPVALCFVTWMANPYGPRITGLAGKIGAIPEVTWSIFEWMPLIYYPGFNLPWPAYAGLAALLALALLAWRLRAAPVPWWHIAIVAAFLALALYQRRQAGLLAAVLPAMLAPHLAGLDSRLARPRWMLPAAVPACAVVICALKVGGVLQTGGATFPETGRNCLSLPCGTTDWLAANRPPANMFNSYGIGGYLLYHLGPETKVFIDGRLDVYDHRTWRELLDAQEARLPLDELIRRHNLRTFVVDIRDWQTVPAHIAPRLAAVPDMRLVYFDDGEAVFVRDAPETRAYLATRELRHVSPFAPARLAGALTSKETAVAAVAEMRRMVSESMGSANAMALAAMAARLGGDMVSARRFLADAFARDPKCAIAASEKATGAY